MAKFDHNKKYNQSDAESIVDYAQTMVGKNLLQISDSPIEQYNGKGKGHFGILVEEHGFGYEANSDPDADFKEVGMELKVCPLTTQSSKDIHLIRTIDMMHLKVKERLVLCMFDLKEYILPIEQSHLWRKVGDILMMFYRYERGVPQETQIIEYVFRYILETRPNDLLVIKQDYKQITDKVAVGEAHELSEGMTNYLGVCRKGQGGAKEKPQPQPNSDILAKRRAFCLKVSYMKQLWKELVEKRKHTDIFTMNELSALTLDEMLLSRLDTYKGYMMSQLGQELNFGNSTNKARFAKMISELVLNDRKDEVNEIKKAGISLKIIRVNNKTLKPYESMSFPNIQYNEIVNEEEWEDSHLYSLFSNRFLFVVIGQNERKDTDGRILDSFLWSMPTSDEEIAKEFWHDCKEKVANGDLTNFWKLSDKKNFHIRPKGQNSRDLTYNTPTGEGWKKYCYWMNAQYIHEIITNHFYHKHDK